MTFCSRFTLIRDIRIFCGAWDCRSSTKMIWSRTAERRKLKSRKLKSESLSSTRPA
jgi:hypothetical protein